tara:strand:- start:1898 stop:3283 length:1386 start_codon:yes stop_codon:yes gene_type:complete
MPNSNQLTESLLTPNEQRAAAAQVIAHDAQTAAAIRQDAVDRQRTANSAAYGPLQFVPSYGELFNLNTLTAATRQTLDSVAPAAIGILLASVFDPEAVMNETCIRPSGVYQNSLQLTLFLGVYLIFLLIFAPARGVVLTAIEDNDTRHHTERGIRDAMQMFINTLNTGALSFTSASIFSQLSSGGSLALKVLFGSISTWPITNYIIAIRNKKYKRFGRMGWEGYNDFFRDSKLKAICATLCESVFQGLSLASTLSLVVFFIINTGYNAWHEEDFAHTELASFATLIISFFIGMLCTVKDGSTKILTKLQNSMNNFYFVATIVELLIGCLHKEDFSVDEYLHKGVYFTGLAIALGLFAAVFTFKTYINTLELERVFRYTMATMAPGRDEQGTAHNCAILRRLLDAAIYWFSPLVLEEGYRGGTTHSELAEMGGMRGFSPRRPDTRFSILSGSPTPPPTDEPL